ncbi:nickel ABC transporter substrate-binding protein [Pelosinus baikalensis]|uniref:ABC transporter substrate-binding protein n=1 Tax=Pelosinus baikalensis TaxID=2892015 RepID=A0ABS8HYJ1_9FIRM|nr:nickel ABC transporter substrate-binding protein [Pelosinus baikalensis]MCC5468027.1 ABC transporter substrate-binding protein [Pelosinus baikalensis]
MYSFINQKNNFLTILCSLFLCAAILMSGCSKDTNQLVNENDKKLTLIFNLKTGSLDPHNSEVALKAGVVETLVRLDDNLEVKPWLATKWEATDGRTWVFTIRDGVTFQDGTTLDAAAVKASFERGIAVSKLLAGVLKSASIEASGQQLTIITKQPHPSLPSELVSPYASIISVEAEKKMGTAAFNMAPVGTGPFKITKFTPNIDILLDRYDGYWDGKAKLSQVNFKFNEDGNVRALALQSKEADVVYQIPPETVAAIQKDNQLRVDSIASLRVHFLLFNHQQPLLQDVRVRKALDLLINRQSIAKDIMLGYATPANGPFNPNLPFGNKDAIKPLNTAEAKKLLEEAGFKAGSNGKLEKDGRPLTFQMLTYKGRPELPLIAQLLQSDAAKIGVDLQIKMVENIDTYLRENKDWDLVTYSNLTAPRGDGGYFLNSAFLPGGSLNASNINSSKLNEIVARLNVTGDISRRVKISQEAAAVINEEVLHSYAVYPNLIVAMNKRVVGWKPSAAEYYVISNKVDVK